MKSTARDKPAPGWRPDQLRAGPSRSSRTGRGRGRARRRCFPAPPVRCGAPTPSGTRARRPPAPPSLPSSSSCAAGSRGHDVARPFRFRTGTWTGECASCPGAVNLCTPPAPLVSLPPSRPGAQPNVVAAHRRVRDTTGSRSPSKLQGELSASPCARSRPRRSLPSLESTRYRLWLGDRTMQQGFSGWMAIWAQVEHKCFLEYTASSHHIPPVCSSAVLYPWRRRSYCSLQPCRTARGYRVVSGLSMDSAPKVLKESNSTSRSMVTLEAPYNMDG